MFNNAMRGLIVICLLVAGKSAQAEERYLFDKDKTSLSFSVSRFGVFETDGKFTDYDGSFVFSARHPDRDAVSVTLYAAGIDTSDEETDKMLRGPDFFNAQQFPTVRFVSTAVQPAENDDAKIIGNLTLLGVTKPVTFDAHFTEKEYDEDRGEYVVSFTATTTIKRSDFGMDHLIPIIGDEVDLQVEVRGIEEKP